MRVVPSGKVKRILNGGQHVGDGCRMRMKVLLRPLLQLEVEHSHAIVFQQDLVVVRVDRHRILSQRRRGEEQHCEQAQR
jgi:hypothetical protein